MTTPTPEQIERTAGRLIDRARELVTDPNNMDARREYMKAAFNTDLTAGAILHLADRSRELEDALSAFVEFEERYDADKSVREADVNATTARAKALLIASPRILETQAASAGRPRRLP